MNINQAYDKALSAINELFSIGVRHTNRKINTTLTYNDGLSKDKFIRVTFYLDDDEQFNAIVDKEVELNQSGIHFDTWHGDTQCDWDLNRSFRIEL